MAEIKDILESVGLGPFLSESHLPGVEFLEGCHSEVNCSLLLFSNHHWKSPHLLKNQVHFKWCKCFLLYPINRLSKYSFAFKRKVHKMKGLGISAGTNWSWMDLVSETCHGYLSGAIIQNSALYHIYIHVYTSIHVCIIGKYVTWFMHQESSIIRCVDQYFHLADGSPFYRRERNSCTCIKHVWIFWLWTTIHLILEISHFVYST